KYSAKGLLEVANKNDDKETLQASGMDFDPARDSWVASAGISLVLTGAENTMNADGLVTVRFSDNKFSGILIEANAYMLTKMDKNVTPGDNGNNKGTLVKAKTIIGFENAPNYHYFRLSICLKSKMSLSDLLAGVNTTELNAFGGKVKGAIHSGLSMVTSPNIATSLVKAVEENGSELSSHSEADREAAANASESGGTTGKKPAISASMEIQIPFDFELKHYKKSYEGHKKGQVDWYVALGKPKYEDRLRLKASIDLVVVSAETEFTFYMQTGNAFAYEMPPLSKELQDFFGIAESGKKLDANSQAVKNSRKISDTDWLKIDKAGGFCLGATFHAGLELNFFLYIDISADLGFDVALLDVNGLGCPGYPRIGQNDFYALGRIYAALQGDVGLKINLGFWKGKFSLFSAGVGALLQGGGPNPSYCYGLLRFKVNLLNGLIKFSTSCDFKLGDVCVPGAGDPLANVKLFENVTPGFETEKEAKDKSNLQSPLQIGTIVSNMPWNRDVFLADNNGKNARRFRFQLMAGKCRYDIKSTENGSYASVSNSQALNFTYSKKDANVMLFECADGGLVANSFNRLKLSARAFEYRNKSVKDLGKILNDKGKDVMYNYADGSISNENPGSTQYGWFDPIFFNDETNRYDIKPFVKDSIFYFKTNPLDSSLKNQVVFSWPYNGETHFPAKEYVHSEPRSGNSGMGSYYNQYQTTASSGPIPYCNMYMFKQRKDLLDKNTLTANGQELKIYLLKAGLEDGELAECDYNYYNTSTVPYLSVQLPEKEYGLTGGWGARMLKFIIVDKDAFNDALAAAMEAADITMKQTEYSSRISDETYNLAEQAHAQASGRGRRGNTGSGGGGGGGHVIVGSLPGSNGFQLGERLGGSSSGSGSGGTSGMVLASSGSSSGSGGSGTAHRVTRGTTTSGSSGTSTTTALSGRALQGLAGNGSGSTNILSGTVVTSRGGTTTTTSSSGTVSRKVAQQVAAAANNSTGTSGRTGTSVRDHTGRTSSSSSNFRHNRRNDRVVAAVQQSTAIQSTLNIQNEMLDEIYMEMQEDGKDSMTYIRTMLKEGYKISSAIGKEIYQWTWFVDPYYNTYKEMLEGYFGQNMSNFKTPLLHTASTDKGDYVQVQSTKVANDPMGKLGFLFLKYDPEDPNRYSTNCAMPPICYFTIRKTSNNRLIAAHQRNFQYLLDLESDFKKTELETVFHSYCDDEQIKWKESGSTLMNGTTAAEYRKIIKKGLIMSSSDANDFLHIDHRIKGNSDFAQCIPANYHPSTWDLPCILETYVKEEQQREPLDDMFFETRLAYAAPIYTPNQTENWEWYLKDYATIAMMDDISKIRGFMNDMQRHAKALDGRGWSYKRKIINRFSDASHINSFMTYTAFPYDMPEIFRVNHFVKAIDMVTYHTRKKVQYFTTSGTYCGFYNHDNDYIPADELQLQDRYWAKYWWHTYAQNLDLEHQGFDRTFYTEDKKRYYNTMEPLNANGKHNVYDDYKTILGDWYRPDPDLAALLTKEIYIYNNVSILYLTSQNASFSENLMKIAQAMKTSDKEKDIIFFPNAQMNDPAQFTFYPVKFDTLKSSNKNKLFHAYQCVISTEGLSND
ncbi:MAG: hypothetical protein IKR77_01435, partial [Bacteroidales bacterium]|nr:hypothetical protein [Bacteroidales bacterium]